MKRYLLLFTVALACTVATSAQTTRALKKVMELKMPKTADDDKPGTRGASVAWHPIQKKYYAVMAGNAEYPLAVFNALGKRISGDDAEAMMDTRGIWYNADTKKICGNAYSEFGWFSYTLDAKGLPTDHKVDFEGMYQPDAQSVGTYLAAKKKVMFLKGSQLWFYNAGAALDATKTAIHWGLTSKDGIAEDEDVEEAPQGYNYTSVISSNVPGAEAGVLNIVDKQVELYNIKTGFLAQKLTLPEDAPTEGSFNFAFANGIYWLFDMENRVWYGYK
ncbi:hypothetical protein [Ferruginibacter sp.]